MPCFAPHRGFHGKDVNPETGLRPIVFDKRKSHSGVALVIPCGKCIGCVKERARQWAIRCMHEKRMHSESAFVTLTYSDEFLPLNGSLDKRALQLFMKRLRKVRPVGLRFFACGEYGETTGRPHYHLLLFNTDFADKVVHSRASHGAILYASDELRSIWSFGNNIIGEVTDSSCAYVAQYVLKKADGSLRLPVRGRAPEFTVMSRRPGIGYPWYEAYQSEAYAHDSVIKDGRETGIPRFYDTKFKGVDGKRLDKLKRERRLRAKLHKADSTLRRLRVREMVELKKAAFFKRDRHG